MSCRILDVIAGLGSNASESSCSHDANRDGATKENVLPSGASSSCKVQGEKCLSDDEASSPTASKCKSILVVVGSTHQFLVRDILHFAASAIDDDEDDHDDDAECGEIGICKGVDDTEADTSNCEENSGDCVDAQEEEKQPSRYSTRIEARRSSMTSTFLEFLNTLALLCLVDDVNFITKVWTGIHEDGNDLAGEGSATEGICNTNSFCFSTVSVASKVDQQKLSVNKSNNSVMALTTAVISSQASSSTTGSVDSDFFLRSSACVPLPSTTAACSRAFLQDIKGMTLRYLLLRPVFAIWMNAKSRKHIVVANDATAGDLAEYTNYYYVIFAFQPQVQYIQGRRKHFTLDRDN